MKALSLFALFAVTLTVDAQCQINFGGASAPGAGAFYAPAPGGCNGGGVVPGQAFAPSFAQGAAYAPPMAFAPAPYYAPRSFAQFAPNYAYGAGAALAPALFNPFVRAPFFNPFFRGFGFRNHH